MVGKTSPVRIASTECQLMQDKPDVPGDLTVCCLCLFFVFEFVSPQGHGDSIRLYLRCATNKNNSLREIWCSFVIFLVELFPWVPAHEMSLVFNY